MNREVRLLSFMGNVKYAEELQLYLVKAIQIVIYLTYLTRNWLLNLLKLFSWLLKNYPSIFCQQN